MNSTPIAYQSGHAGPLIHVECWSDHDAKTRARTGQMAYLGTLVYPGHPLLKTARCGFCGKPILPLKTSAVLRAQDMAEGREREENTTVGKVIPLGL